MAADLHTTAAVINYTVAIFLVTIGMAPLVWSPLSGFYGRRPIYLASMPIHVIASIGVARSNTVGAIIGTRILQGIGGSCVLAVGAGSIGDIYR
jgi:MFS family permease